MEMDLIQSMMYVGNIAVNMGIRIGLLFLLIAAADYPYQRYKLTKSLKMTKQEVKEEYKMVEGDPKVKAKIKQKMRQASLRRMMQEVPGADVIITNPTHYAVAIKYDKTVSIAPVVVAKGVDYMAKRIREKAVECNVEVVENKQLARTIYSTVDIGGEIPVELYQAVAEVLAFVYRLRNKGA
jgi:flagellar biosynthetic protein FlhB